MNKQKTLVYDEHQLLTNATEKQFNDAYKRQRNEARDILNRFSNGQNVLLLADDVGLGKTWVSMITLFSLLTEKKSPRDSKHALILVPTRLLAEKWYNELLTFQRNYLKNGGKEFAIELTTSSENLIKRLEMVESQTTSKRTLQKFFESDKSDESSLAFMAFCLNEYLNAEGIGKAEISDGTSDEKETEYTKIRKWIRSALKQENAPLLHRFFTQYEVVRWVRFLRRYAAEIGYNKWLEDHHAQPEKIVKALERRRAGRQYNFIKSINDALDLNYRARAIQKKLFPIGRRFLRLASETMPFLEAYQTDSNRSWQEKVNNEDYAKTINFLKTVEKDDQKAKETFCYIIRNTLELMGENIKGKGSLALDQLKAVISKETPTNKKHEDLNPRELIQFVSNFISYVRTQEGIKRNESLFEKSPWIYSDWNQNKQTTTFDTFVIELVNELRSTSRRTIKLNSSAIKRFLNCAKSLYIHLINPSKGITYNFFDRKKILHNIFIMYMNDLKQWGSIKNAPKRELEQLKNINKKPFQLVVIDEAHNWTHKNKRGNKEYKQYFQDLTQKTLLVTATPLQLSHTDLQSIFLAVQDQKIWANNPAYEKLFPNETDHNLSKAKDKQDHTLPKAKDEQDYTLSKAKDKQDAVLKEWKNLGQCGQRLEALSASISNLSGEKLKKKQLEIWKRLQKSEEPQIQNMANAVCDLRSFLDQITDSLGTLVIKNKLTKKRDYHCGKDALISPNILKTQTVNKYEPKLHFYPVDGIPNSASLFNFICMRLSSRSLTSNNTSVNESPKLMLGLPSSYRAMLNSKNGETVNTSKNDEYYQLYENLINKDDEDFSLDLKHPKIVAVLNIICNNLLQNGEKTLIFCERRETVKVLEKLLTKRIRDFYKPFMTKNNLNKIHSLIEKITNKKDEFSVATELKDLIEKLANQFLITAFGNTVKNQGNLVKEQESYDARQCLSIWVICDWIKTSYDNENKKENETKIINALNDTLYSLCQNTDNYNLEDETKIYEFVASLTGNTSKSRPAILKSFSTFGLPLVLICTPVSQEGVDMHKYCRHIILHDLNWNPAKLEQRIGRVDRQGSLASAKKLPVEVYVPFLSNSYDDYQYKRVLERANIQELLFGQNDLVVTELNEDNKDPSNEIELEDKSKTYDLPNIDGLIRDFFEVDLSTPKM